MPNKKRFNLVIISGPSGSGQDSVIEGLRKYLPLERVITTTTRKKRPGEKNRHPYYFISKKKFTDMIKRKEFFEYAKHYNGNYYGVSLKEIERVAKQDRIGIWKVDYKGVLSAKKLLPGIKAILLYAPLKVLLARIKKRDNPTEEFLRERMSYSREWLKHKNLYDFKVLNPEGELSKTVEKVYKILAKIMTK